MFFKIVELLVIAKVDYGPHGTKFFYNVCQDMLNRVGRIHLVGNIGQELPVQPLSNRRHLFFDLLEFL